VGLVMMALPALGRHHLGPTPGHGHGVAGGQHPTAGHGAGHGHAPKVADAGGSGGSPGHPPSLPAANLPGGMTTRHSLARLIPSPRAVCSVLALYGAVGNALVHAAHLPVGAAAVVAVGPAALLEWLFIRPVWNLVFRFRAETSSPLEALILSEATAVVPFRNGQGLVTTVRDGRQVQFRARVCERDAALPVAFGQRLLIEEVDARKERVTVSVLPGDSATDPRSRSR
jgi:hypothetical protein